MDINAAIAVASAVFAAVGLIVSIVTALSTVSKNRVDMMAAMLEAVRSELDRVKAELAIWKRRYQCLCDWVREQGLIPPGLWPDD